MLKRKEKEGRFFEEGGFEEGKTMEKPGKFSLRI